MSVINKIYVGQSNIRVYLSTGADITGNTTPTMEVRAPNGSTTTWTSTVDNASAGSIYYDIPTTTTLHTKGKWLLQANIQFTATTSYGRTTELRVWGLYE